MLLVINKIDLIHKDALLPLMDAYSKAHPFLDILPISALEADGLDELKQAIREALPVHPPYYPEDYLTEHSERFFVSEIIREKIFYLYGEEIPYSTTVEIAEFKEKTGRKDYIRAVIYVEKDSQRAILIGKKGQALKRVGSLAREEIEQFLDRPVYLDLWVKVREKWRRNPSAVRQFGYSTNLPK
ncbi:MAG: GTPase Era, partial [Calditrichaeota bacterium]|nr:GTPase Era [Calditrichota bacterium]